MSDPIADIRALFAPLLLEAEGALSRREEQYPALVQAGRMDQQSAAREIDIWRAIVADWRRVVTGTGAKGTQATTDEKMAALADSIGRYEPAIAKAIANESDNVRRDCAEFRHRAYLADRHGKAVARYLELLDGRDRLIDLLMIYDSERPDGRPFRGFFAGVDAYLAFHLSARADRLGKQAA